MHAIDKIAKTLPALFDRLRRQTNPIR